MGELCSTVLTFAIVLSSELKQSLVSTRNPRFKSNHAMKRQQFSLQHQDGPMMAGRDLPAFTASPGLNKVRLFPSLRSFKSRSHRIDYRSHKWIIRPNKGRKRRLPCLRSGIEQSRRHAMIQLSASLRPNGAIKSRSLE
jgi:hypothetical protein